MNEIERRRQELLTRTKNIYNNKKQPPAIHPRYQGMYHSLYEKQKNSSFVVRLAIALTIFLFFFAIHYQSVDIGFVDSKIVVQEIEKNLFSEKFPFLIERFKFFENLRFFN